MSALIRDVEQTILNPQRESIVREIKNDVKETIKTRWQSTPEHNKIVESLDKRNADVQKIKKIVVIGLGSLSCGKTKPTDYHENQMNAYEDTLLHVAMTLTIARQVKDAHPMTHLVTPLPIIAYDPRFDNTDKEVLKELNFTPIKGEADPKDVVDAVTLMFAPFAPFKIFEGFTGNKAPMMLCNWKPPPSEYIVMPNFPFPETADKGLANLALCRLR